MEELPAAIAEKARAFDPAASPSLYMLALVPPSPGRVTGGAGATTSSPSVSAASSLGVSREDTVADLRFAASVTCEAGRLRASHREA